MKTQLTILRGLADRTRLRIIGMLFHGPHCVEEITSRLKMSQPRVSRHLRILRESGLVETRRDRRRIYYSLNESGEGPIHELLAFLEGWLADSSDGEGRATAPSPRSKEEKDRLPSPAVSDLEDFLL